MSRGDLVVPCRIGTVVFHRERIREVRGAAIQALHEGNLSPEIGARIIARIARHICADMFGRV